MRATKQHKSTQIVTRQAAITAQRIDRITRYERAFRFILMIEWVRNTPRMQAATVKRLSLIRRGNRLAERLCISLLSGEPPSMRRRIVKRAFRAEPELAKHLDYNDQIARYNDVKCFHFGSESS